MTEKPYTVEVRIAAPHDAVWRALTDPAEIRRWFGWEYDGLVQEIDFIFREHAKAQPPDRIEMPGTGERIELADDSDATVVRVVRSDGITTAEWDGVYDEIEEGWRAFLHQLRLYLEEHSGKDRRTERSSTTTSPAAAAAALPGQVVASGRFHRYTRTADGMSVLISKAPIDSDAPAPVTTTLTTYALRRA